MTYNIYNLQTCKLLYSFKAKNNSEAIKIADEQIKLLFEEK
jgi:hypothetical protein